MEMLPFWSHMKTRISTLHEKFFSVYKKLSWSIHTVGLQLRLLFQNIEILTFRTTLNNELHYFCEKFFRV